MEQGKRIAFISGITGQDGSYLAELLLSKNYKVYGIQRRTSSFVTSRIDHIRDKMVLKYGDLTDGLALANYLTSIVQSNPGFERFEIYNLGAQSHVAVSFEIPEYTTDVDATGTLRILDTIRTFSKEVIRKTRFYQAGTSEMFGKVLETPQKETTPFNPQSPYACAKVYAFFLTKLYREGYGLFATNGILFNHESSRRGGNFVTKKIVDAVKRIVAGKQQCVELGNLDSERDWGYAKDYVLGMWQMLQLDQGDDFVLSTGKKYTVRLFVEKAFAFKGISIEWTGSGTDEIGKDQEGMVRVKINPMYYRPCEVDLLIGDSTKAQKAFAWDPSIKDIESLIQRMFEDE